MFTLIVLQVVLAVAPAAFTQRITGEEVEYVREFKNGARLRVVRVPLETPKDDEPTTRLDATTQQVVTVADYRFIFAPSEISTDRHVFTEFERRNLTFGTWSHYHTWTAELSDDSLLILIYASGGADCVHVLDVSAPEPKRTLPPHPLTFLTWGTTGPPFLSAQVGGSLEKESLTVDVQLRTDPSKEHRATWQEPLGERIRLRLRKIDGKWSWFGPPPVVALTARPMARAGEEVPLTFTVENRDEDTLIYHGGIPERDGVEFDFLLDVKRDGRDVAFTPFGEKLAKRLGVDRRRIEVAPGKSEQYTLDLAKLRDLTVPGDYTVSATFRATRYPEAAGVKFAVGSNTITIKVEGKGAH